jgi:hypothetical protein
MRNKKKTHFLRTKFEILRSRDYIREGASERAGLACMHPLLLAADGRRIHGSAFYRWYPLTWRLGSSRAGLDTAVLLRFVVAPLLV